MRTAQERHISIGAAIERAAEKLPEGYFLTIDLEQGAGTVTLMMPPTGADKGGGLLSDWGAETFGDQINDAIDYAIEHHRTHAE